MRLCSTFGRSGCVQSESREPTLISDENAHRVSDDEPFAVDFSLGRPRSGRARLDELGWLALQLGILLHPFERHLRPSGGRQWPTVRRQRDELTIDCSKLTNRRTKKRICKSINQSRYLDVQKCSTYVIRNGRSERQDEASQSRVYARRKDGDHGGHADDGTGQQIEPNREPTVDCKKKVRDAPNKNQQVAYLPTSSNTD